VDAVKRDGRARSSLLKMLMVDLHTFNTFLAEFEVRATARLLQPWTEDALAGILAEHRPDLIVFEDGDRAAVEPLAGRLAAASPEPFVPVFADSQSPPASVAWPPPWAEPIPLPGSVDPLDLRDVIAKIAWEAHLAESKQWSNPLTGLPGNPAIRAEVERRLQSGAQFTLLYLDYDHFKAFNDAYGFSQGDAAILLLSQILREIVEERGNADDFIGHIGGDDFAVVTTPDRAEDIARGIIDRIGPEVEAMYSEQDRRRGHTVIQGRRGRERYPLMTLSIAGVSNATRPLDSYLAVSEIAAEIKAHAKAKLGSNYVPDRRRGESVAMTEKRDEEKISAAAGAHAGGWGAVVRMPGWAQGLLVLNLLIAIFVGFLTVRVDQLFRAVKGGIRPTGVSGAVAPAPPKPLVLANFEGADISSWGTEGYKGAIAKSERSPAAHQGKQSLQLLYSLGDTGAYVVLSHRLAKGATDWSKYQALQLMVQRPNDGNAGLRLLVRDAGPYRWTYDLGTGPYDWKTQTIKLSDLVGLGASNENAPANAKPDWTKVREIDFVVVSNKGATGGLLRLDDLRLLPKEPATAGH
jgi:diguanylate cyclase (GGDEF)-like protein